KTLKIILTGFIKCDINISKSEFIHKKGGIMKVGGYDLPDELYYHGEHTWLKKEEDGNVKIGMNAMWAGTAGDVTYIDLPFEGDEVSQGDTCGKLQSAKWIAKLIAPISGEILKVNEELEDDSTKINQDPYGAGWIVVIKPSNLDTDLESLYHGDTVAPWMEAEIKKSEELKK
ncbi:glycine cleavage system protein H, partial [candidate division WOR-3 bacterium]|nr:glycine cleavage system protein H [candidate division WOR-3 bacterium]